ncbi:MAG: winged helix-turn-helix domain-containing protein [Muribaculaceae bacterium]|nr:winged helix-turn-helix domain-containing protein [Muribaculaceae bacterium]
MFVDSLVVNGATDVMLKFKQKDLCTLLGTQRTTLVATLDKLAEQEIIEYDSNVLRVLDYYQLIDLLK